jgi:hypothetical protein
MNSPYGLLSRVFRPSSFVPRLSSRVLRPSSFVPRLSSRVFRPSSFVPRLSSLVPRPPSFVSRPYQTERHSGFRFGERGATKQLSSLPSTHPRALCVRGWKRRRDGANENRRLRRCERYAVRADVSRRSAERKSACNRTSESRCVRCIRCRPSPSRNP